MIRNEQTKICNYVERRSEARNKSIRLYSEKKGKL